MYGSPGRRSPWGAIMCSFLPYLFYLAHLARLLSSPPCNDSSTSLLLTHDFERPGQAQMLKLSPPGSSDGQATALSQLRQRLGQSERFLDLAVRHLERAEHTQREEAIGRGYFGGMAALDEQAMGPIRASPFLDGPQQRLSERLDTLLDDVQAICKEADHIERIAKLTHLSRCQQHALLALEGQSSATPFARLWIFWRWGTPFPREQTAQLPFFWVGD